jgi:sugar transferase (PEP-CTERM/EpsH1 system associated)
MKVLFITEEFPYPLDTGGNVRTFHLLRALASQHDVVLLAMNRAGLEPAQVVAVRRLVREVHLVESLDKGIARELGALCRSAVSGVPFILERHRSRPLQRKLQALVATESFDAVHFNHLDAALYAPVVPRSMLRILDQHNVVTNQVKTTLASETRALRRMVLRADFPRLSKLEATLCNQMQTCLVCSDDDASHLRNMGVASRLAVVPNGVDLDFFRPGTELAAAPRLAFVGTLDYDPCERGLWYFCNEILPKIRAKLPGATFTAIGRNPSQRLLELAGPERGIEFTGRVEDLRPHVQAARVFVVPLLSGSGTRLKILEAMAMGVPVVSTTIGAEGIDGADGEHFRIADGPEAFAQAVLELIGDTQLALRIRARARQLVERSFSWQEAGRRMLAAYPGDDSRVRAIA